MEFFQSGLGMYLQQVIVHSAVAAVVVASVVKLWGLSELSQRLRFHFLPLALPLVTPLAYGLLHPGWGGTGLNGWALLDSGRWLELRPWGQPVFGYLLLLAMVLGTVLFLVQEVLPSLEQRRHSPLRPLQPGEAPALEAALSRLARASGRPSPPVLLTNHSEPLAYTSGVRQPRLVVSRRLLEVLDREEIEGVVAHEVAHLHRRDHRTGWLLLLLRLLTFYNPVALLSFRWMVQGAEQECDAQAAAWTGKPLALAAGLIRVFREGEPTTYAGGRGLSGWVGAMDHSLHRSLVEDRVRRLSQDTVPAHHPYAWWRWGLTAVSLSGLLFMVV